MGEFRYRWLVGAFLALVAAVPHPASAQSFPSRDIKLIVGFAAGGGTDVLARALAEGLRKLFNVPVVVENRPGANSSIAAQAVAAAPPDGYTLLVAGVGLTANIFMTPKPSYDPIRDFNPISLLVVSDGVLVVTKDFPARNLAELIGLTRSSPGKYTYGVSGFGSPTHIGAELMKKITGLDMTVVPYRGDAQVANDLMSGALSIGMMAMNGAGTQIEAGTIRGLVLMGNQRHPSIPDVPTIVEAGFPAGAFQTWLGLLAPAGTPPAVVQTLADASRRVMADPAMKKMMDSQFNRIVATSPEEFSQHLKREIAKWTETLPGLNLAQPQ